MIELFCLSNNLKNDYIGNIGNNNREEIFSPDLIIKNETKNSIFKKNDKLEFKIRNSELTDLEINDIVESTNRKYKTKGVEGEVYIFIINYENIFNSLNKQQRRVIAPLRKEILKKAKMLRWKKSYGNRMEKILYTVKQKGGLKEGEEWFETFTKTMENVERFNGTAYQKKKMDENYLKLETKYIGEISKQSVKAEKVIKNMMCKTEDLMDSKLGGYKKAFSNKENISAERPYERDYCSSKFDTTYGHKGKFLLDFEVKGLVINKDEEFVNFCESLTEEDCINLTIKDDLDRFYYEVDEEGNKKYKINKNDEVRRLLLERENERRKDILKSLLNMIKANSITREGKKEVEVIVNNLAILKNTTLKEAKMNKIKPRALQFKIEQEEKKLKKKINEINKELKEKKLEFRLQKNGYLSIPEGLYRNFLKVKSESKKDNKTEKIKEDEKDESNISDLKDLLSKLVKQEKNENDNNILKFTQEKIFVDQFEMKHTEEIDNIMENIKKIKFDDIKNYWPELEFKDPYLSGLKEVSNKLLTETEKSFEKMKEDPAVRYCIIKHLIMKQFMITLPFTASKSLGTNNFACRQIDNLNMFMIGTPNANKITGGIMHLFSEHINEDLSDCIEDHLIFKKDNRIIKVSLGMRLKTKELLQYFKMVGVCLGHFIFREHYGMGESNLFNSLFLRFNRDLVEITDHINLMFKNVFFDHTLGKIDMVDEFQSLIVKDTRVKEIILQVEKNYKNFCQLVKDEEIDIQNLQKNKIKDFVFGFNLNHIQSWLSLVYIQSMFYKDDGFSDIDILMNFLIKDIEQNEDRDGSPFNQEELIKKLFYSDNIEESFNVLYKNEDKYNMSTGNVFVASFGTYLAVRNNKFKPLSSKIQDEILMKTATSSGCLSYTFKNSEEFVKNTIKVTKVKQDIKDIFKDIMEELQLLIDEMKEEKSKNKKPGNKFAGSYSLGRFIEKVLKKYKLSKEQKETLKKYFLIRISRNKAFLQDVKLPEELYMESVRILKEIKRVVKSNLEIKEEVSKLYNNIEGMDINDIRISDEILFSLFDEEFDKKVNLVLILDVFTKLQRGKAKRLIYKCIGSPFLIFYKAIDKAFDYILADSDIDLLSKKGAKKYELLERMAGETLSQGEYINFATVDQKRFGDKYLVEILMWVSFCLYRLEYFTKNEILFILTILNTLFNRATIIPELMAKKVRYYIFCTDKERELMEEREPKIVEKIKKIIDNMVIPNIGEQFPGTQYNIYILKSVGFVLGVFNRIGSLASDIIGHIMKMIMNTIFSQLRLRVKTQSDDVTYSMKTNINKCDFEGVFMDKIYNKIKDSRFYTSIKGDEFYKIGDNSVIIDKNEFILNFWCTLLTVELCLGQTPSPRKTAMAKMVGELLQMLLIKNKCIPPFIKEVTSLSSAMVLKSPSNDISSMAGSLYTLFINGADNLLLTKVQMLMNFIVIYLYRLDDKEFFEENKINRFHVPCEIGGQFYIYPDLLKTIGFTGNFIRLINLGKNDKLLKRIFKNTTNNGDIFSLNKMDDEKKKINKMEMSSDKNITKLQDDNELDEKHYVGSCFKDFKITIVGKTYTKTMLYSMFMNSMNILIKEIIIDLPNMININKYNILFNLKRVIVKKDISIYLNDETKNYLKTIEEDLSFISIGDINNIHYTNCISQFIKCLDRELSTMMKASTPNSYLNSIKYLSKYLKPSYQESYIKPNESISARNYLNYKKWKVTNSLTNKVRDILNMKEGYYTITEMKRVPIKLALEKYKNQESKSLFKLINEVLNTQLLLESKIHITLDIREKNDEHDLNFEWVEQKEEIGGNRFLRDLPNLMNCIIQKFLLGIEFKDTSVLRRFPVLLLDNIFMKDLDRLYQILKKLGFLNDKLNENSTLLSKILTGVIKFKVFRVFEKSNNEILHNTRNNLYYKWINEGEISIEDQIFKITSRESKLNNFRLEENTMMVGLISMVNKEVKSVSIEGVEYSKEFLTSTLYDMMEETDLIRFDSTLTFLTDKNEINYNFFEYEGKKSNHYIIFSREFITILTDKDNKGKYKIKTTRNNRRLAIQDGYRVSRSLVEHERQFNGGHNIYIGNEIKSNYILIDNEVHITEVGAGKVALFMNLQIDFKNFMLKTKTIEIRSKDRVIIKTLDIGRIGICENNIIKLVERQSLNRFLTESNLDTEYINFRNEIIEKKKEQFRERIDEIQRMGRFASNEEMREMRRLTFNLENDRVNMNSEDNELFKKEIGNIISEEINEAKKDINIYLKRDKIQQILDRVYMAKLKLKVFRNVRIIGSWRTLTIKEPITLNYENGDSRIMKNAEIEGYIEVEDRIDIPFEIVSIFYICKSLISFLEDFSDSDEYIMLLHFMRLTKNIESLYSLIAEIISDIDVGELLIDTEMENVGDMKVDKIDIEVSQNKVPDWSDFVVEEEDEEIIKYKKKQYKEDHYRGKEEFEDEYERDEEENEEDFLNRKFFIEEKVKGFFEVVNEGRIPILINLLSYLRESRSLSKEPLGVIENLINIEDLTISKTFQVMLKNNQNNKKDICLSYMYIKYIASLIEENLDFCFFMVIILFDTNYYRIGLLGTPWTKLIMLVSYIDKLSIELTRVKIIKRNTFNKCLKIPKIIEINENIQLENKLSQNQEKLIKKYYNMQFISKVVINCYLMSSGISPFMIIKKECLRKIEFKNDTNIDLWVGNSIQNEEERNIFLSGIFGTFPFIIKGVLLKGFKIKNMWNLTEEK